MTRYVWEEEKDSKQSSHFTTAGTFPWEHESFVSTVETNV